MVDEIVTRQELIDAKRDARDLGKAVNEKVIVSPRYGDDFKSLPMIAGEFQDAINTIVIDGGVPALAVSDASGKNQQELNNSMRIEIEKLRKGGQFLELKQFDPDGSGSGVKATQAYIDKANAWYALTGVDEPRFKFGFDSQDFVAAQWALDTAGYNGQTLILNNADYVLTKCLIVKFNNVTVIGTGKLSSKFSQKAAAGWLAEFSDDSQFLVGGKVYGVTNYGTGKNWAATKVFKADNFKIQGVGIVGDMTGFSTGGWYMAGGGSNAPALQTTQLYQSGIQVQGELARFSKNIEITDCYFSGHAECAVEPSYVDNLVVDRCYATENGWQFFGTDHAIKNVWITNNIGIEPAVGSSESAFIDLEEGQGADFENIVISGNIHIATISGFVKIHPRMTNGFARGTNVRNVVISDNISISGGAPTLGFYGHYWTGSQDISKEWGNVDGLTITGNVIRGYKNNVFRVGASDGGTGFALNTVIDGNYIEGFVGACGQNTCVFDLPQTVKNCTISNNVVRMRSSTSRQYFSRIGWQNPASPNLPCENIRIIGNDVRIFCAGIIDVAFAKHIYISGNKFDATGSFHPQFGGFLGLVSAESKEHIYVTDNWIKVNERGMFLSSNTIVNNLTISGNYIDATNLKYHSGVSKGFFNLFTLNDSITNVTISNNEIISGETLPFNIGLGASITDPLRKVRNVKITGNKLTHSCAETVFDIAQAVNLDISDNKVTNLVGGSGITSAAYAAVAHLHLEGVITVKDNTFIGLGSGANRTGIKLTFKTVNPLNSAIVSGNVLQAASGSYMTTPILVDGAARSAMVIGNTILGMENLGTRGAISVEGVTATPKIEALVATNLISGGAATVAYVTNANVNVTLANNHIGTTYTY